MAINLTVPTSNSSLELKPRISVIGVGGAGGNAVNNMIQMGLEGVEFVVANSDAQALANSSSERKIQMGAEVTKGLGAGSNPTIGRAAAEESLEEILTHLNDVNMVFVTAGLGGGTGTGAAPVIAKVARDHGILTVGVVTKPFQFEGVNRMKIAEMGLEELQQYVDTLLIIPNQNLFRVANEKTTFADAFKMADDVLYSGVRGVTDLMVMPGLINLDFADIKSVMSEMGKAMMGTGEAAGERRATDAAEAAIANPLLDDASMHGAKGVLINITAGKDITLFEVDEAANRIRDEVAEDANIIFGSTFEESLEGSIRVSVVATGIEAVAANQVKPATIEATDGIKRNFLVPDAITAPKDRENPAPLLSTEKASPAESSDTSMHENDENPVELVKHDLVEQIVQSKIELAESTNKLEADYSTSSDEVFIPAPPVNVASTLEKSADPFAEADMLNAGAEKEKKKVSKKLGPSLMERVTRATLGQRKSGKKEGMIPDSSDIIRPPVGSSSKPVNQLSDKPENEYLSDITLSEVENSPSTEKGFVTASKILGDNKQLVSMESDVNHAPESGADLVGEEEYTAPTLLGNVDTEHDLGQNAPDEDLLDIPAFLRRQAN